MAVFGMAVFAVGLWAAPRADAEVTNGLRAQLALALSPAEAKQVLKEAKAILPGGSLVEGEIETHLATVALRAGDPEEAESAALRALELFESLDPDFEVAADALAVLGDVQWNRGAYAEAQSSYERALGILQSRGVAEGRTDLLRGLGMLSERLADYPQADRYLEQAIESAEPGSLEMARALGERGYLHISWWRLATAREYNEAAHHLLMTLGNQDLRLSLSHARLGHTARFQGDLATAEWHYSKALELRKHLGDLRGVGLHLANLANLARQRGQYDTALSLYREALERYDRDPKAVVLTTRARLLSNLGRTLLLLGRADEAAVFLTESLAMKRQVAGDSPDVAASLMLLGDLERSRGRGPEARERYTEALAVHGRQIPGSPAEAENQVRLAQLEATLGARNKAEALLRSAVATLEQRAPMTTATAEALYHLARLQHDEGRHPEALQLYRRAAAALDAQWQNLGGSTEERLTWMDDHTEIYRALMDLLVEKQLYDEAFDVLQRFRARVLRDILSERNWQLPTTERGRELEAELIDLTRERQVILDRLGTAAPGEVATLAAELDGLADRRTRALTALRDEAPEPSQLLRPGVLDIQQAGAALEPGTALVSYAVGTRSTVAFVLRRDADGSVYRSAARLPIGRNQLRRDVEAFRAALLRHSSSELEDMESQAEALFRQLLQPVETEVARADRILLATDGPLHRLPFAALRREGRYLIEWKPVHHAPSMATYSSLLQTADASGEPVTSAAFGDPIYRDTVTPSSPRATRGPELDALPWTRFEVNEVSRYLPAPVRVYVGSEATEAQVKKLGTEQIIHFAGHAVLDEHRPLQSALVLTQPDEESSESENGLLHAWEIIEELKLQASLVTLSACGTALGREHDAEGLLGLVWAFHHAGARSVVASQWSVADQSTAHLMSRFYAGLAKGLPKDKALRQAQLAFLQGETFGRSESSETKRGVGGLVARDAPAATESQPTSKSHPFYWAAFQLYGPTRP